MLKKWKTAALLAAFAILTVSLTGCGKASSSSEIVSKKKAYTHEIFAMDTYMTMKIYGGGDGVLVKAEKRIQALEEELSVNRKNSDIWNINKNAGSEVKISVDTRTILRKAAEISDKTGGALDITLYPVICEWGFTTGDYKIPEPEKLTALLRHVDYRNVGISGRSVMIPENCGIDLGALAKGYTGDELIRVFSSRGVESAIINLGGNVQTLGTKPDGSKWKVAIRDPFDIEEDICTVEVESKAVITSGNYERYFTGEDGKDYWHIIDPTDGYPADNGLVSVTIIGESGIDCDALSTALFVMGKDKAIEFCRSNTDIDAVLVSDDKAIYYTEGIADCFTNLSDMSTEVIRCA